MGLFGPSMSNTRNGFTFGTCRAGPLRIGKAFGNMRAKSSDSPIVVSFSPLVPSKKRKKEGKKVKGKVEAWN